MADPRFTADEDLTDLIATAIGQSVIPDDDDDDEDVAPSRGRVLEAPTQPTFAVPPDDARAEALEAFSSARIAVVSGQLGHARSLLEQAARLDPDDDRYLAYLADLKQRERRAELQGTLTAIREEAAAGRPPVDTRKRIMRQVAVLAAVLVAGVVAQVLLSRGPSYEDLSEDFRHVARFESLVRVPEGGWVARIDEPMWSMAAGDRVERCREIARALPPATVPALVLRSTDGVKLACQR